MRPDRLVQELEDVASRLFDEVRREHGGFTTGACILNGQRLLMINTRQPADERIAALAREIARCNPAQLYLKPAIRDEVERWRTDTPAQPAPEED